MKYCENCGQKIDKNDTYCLKCGKSNLKQVIITKKVNKEGLGTASLVIGIISLILAFLINIFVIPLALIGLILGIVNKAQNGKKISGIILNVLAMILSVLVFIALIVLLVIAVDDYDSEGHSRHHMSEVKEEEVLGKWACKSVEKVLSSDYELILTLDNDKNFMINEYNNDKNYIKGVYYFEDDDLNNYVKSNRNHIIGLNPLEKYEHGDMINSSDDIDETYKMVITKTRNKFHSVLTDDKNEKVYYCNK